MYILVKNIVEKCTLNEEGRALYFICRDEFGKGTIRVDFYGIRNVTDDFIFGFLGTVITNHQDGLKSLHYVRTETYIRSKIKAFSKKMDQQHSKVLG